MSYWIVFAFPASYHAGFHFFLFHLLTKALFCDRFRYYFEGGVMLTQNYDLFRVGHLITWSDSALRDNVFTDILKATPGETHTVMNVENVPTVTEAEWMEFQAMTLKLVPCDKIVPYPGLYGTTQHPQIVTLVIGHENRRFSGAWFAPAA